MVFDEAELGMAQIWVMAWVSDWQRQGQGQKQYGFVQNQDFVFDSPILVNQDFVCFPILEGKERSGPGSATDNEIRRN